MKSSGNRWAFRLEVGQEKAQHAQHAQHPEHARGEPGALADRGAEPGAQRHARRMALKAEFIQPFETQKCVSNGGVWCRR